MFQSELQKRVDRGSFKMVGRNEPILNPFAS